MYVKGISFSAVKCWNDQRCPFMKNTHMTDVISIQDFIDARSIIKASFGSSFDSRSRGFFQVAIVLGIDFTKV